MEATDPDAVIAGPGPAPGRALPLLRSLVEQLAVGAPVESLLATVAAVEDHDRLLTGTAADAPEPAADSVALAAALVEHDGELRRLRTEAERFERLANAVSDAVWEWDLRDDSVWRNSALTTVFGYPEASLEASPEPWFDHIHPDDRDEVIGSLRAAIEGDATFWTRDYRFLRHDGSVARVSDRNRIVRDHHGTAIRVVGGITDISQRWEAEEALRANEARFHDLAEHSSEGIFLQLLLPEPGVAYINPALERMLGYPREAVYADPRLMMRAIPERDRLRMRAELEAAGASTEPIEIDLRHRDGGVRRVRMRGTPLRDEHGRVINIQGAVTDITREHREQVALRTALDRQQELSELKTAFVQAVSHELRTPLTSIRGFVELLLARELPEPEQRLYLRRVAHGAERLNRLVSDVLDLDRFDHPDAIIGTSTVDLAELAIRVSQDNDSGSHPIHLDARTTIIAGDGALLERVIDNLIRNAIKHTPEGTAIWVRTEPPGTIVVEDAGPGIPAALGEQVFEPFRQGPDQLEHPTPGLGIGLALSRRIARLHGGDVELGERPGGGSRFTVTVPNGPTIDA